MVSPTSSVVDRFSHWPEAIPLNDTTATSCAQALVFHWIACFGIPIDMSSDRGPQFTSQLWKSITQLLGTQLHHTTAYHPQSNGLVERFHRHLESALRACLTGPNWTQELPRMLLGIRTVPGEDMGCSSAELVYGAPLTVPGDFISSHIIRSDSKFQLHRLHDHVRSLAPISTSQHGVVPASVPRDLQQAKFVLIRQDAHRTPFQRPYQGPYKVLKTFRVDRGKPETITVNLHTSIWNTLSSPRCHNLMDGRYRTPNLHLQVRPNTTTLKPPIVCSNNAPIQNVASSFHNVTSWFRGKRCSRGDLRTTHRY